MTTIQAVVLGAVQGLTELLPVSSSAHLIAVPRLLGWPDQGLAVDVALHWGTLIAVAAYFWRDWADLLLKKDRRRLLLAIALASVPAAVAGVAVKDFVEGALRGIAPLSCALVAFGLLMGWADRAGPRSKGWEDLDGKTCLLIGLAQALALFPGVSRSGVTITAGLLLGLRREDAARFSFVLSVPIVFGAGVLQLRHLEAGALTAPFGIAVAVAALTGFAVIALFLRYLRGRSLLPFAVYRVLAGLALLAWAA